MLPVPQVSQISNDLSYILYTINKKRAESKYKMAQTEIDINKNPKKESRREYYA